MNYYGIEFLKTTNKKDHDSKNGFIHEKIMYIYLFPCIYIHYKTKRIKIVIITIGLRYVVRCLQCF